MSKVLDINIEQLETMGTQCSESGVVATELEEVSTLLKSTRKLIGFGSGKAYRELEELIEEIDDNIRGIINNTEDFGDACTKYSKNMKALAKPVTSFSDNMFVSDELHPLKTKYKIGGYSGDLDYIKTLLTYIDNNVYLTLGDGAIVDRVKLRDFNQRVQRHCDNMTDKIKEIKNNLADSYDLLESVEDFKSKEYNEVANIAKNVVIGVAVGVATTALATVLLPEAACVAAVIATDAAITAAGTAVVSAAKHYHDGSNITEAAQEGAVDGVKAGATSATMGGVTTVGKAKVGNYKSIKSGNADDVLSNKDALLKTKPYEEVKVGKAKGWSNSSDVKKLGLTENQIQYLINDVKNIPQDAGVSGSIEIALEVVNDEIDNVEYDVKTSDIYAEISAILDELNIDINGDDIWANT